MRNRIEIERNRREDRTDWEKRRAKMMFNYTVKICEICNENG
jgi:hypothetical protein